jgi:hypothetical protein
MRRGILTALMTGTLFLAGCAGSYGGGYANYYASGPPPPVRVEAYGSAPGPGYVWINGNWGYRGSRYEWNGGRWERPPKGHRHWEDGRWEHHGSQYRWHEGHWR